MPAAGMLATQLAAIFPKTPKSTEEVPLASPTPTTDPTRVWVVEMGTARKGRENKRTTVAAANWAANPRVGVMWVIFSPIVFITRWPQVAMPMTIPTLPSNTSHSGTSASEPIAPSL